MQYQPKWENKTLLHIMMTGIPCVKTFLTNFYQHFKSLMVLEPAWARRHHRCGTFEIYQIWNNNLFCRARCWWRNQLYLQLHNPLLGSAMVAGLILNIIILFIIPQKLKIYLKNSSPDCVPRSFPGPVAVPGQHRVCGCDNQFWRLPTLHNIRHWAPAWE